MKENRVKQQEIIQNTNWFKRNRELYGSLNEDLREGYNIGYEKSLQKNYREGFEAGIRFIYDEFPFLADVVDERIKNGDLEEYNAENEETGEKEYWFDDTKWDKVVDKAVSKNIEEIINENETSGNKK